MGVALGALVALALTCKQLLGESPLFATEGMFYNRIGFVFLTLETVLFIPPSVEKNILNVIDGIIIGLICAMLFYIKVTFGIVGIALALVNSMSDGRDRRGKASMLSAAAAVYILVSAAVEFVYGVQFAWLRNIHMALLSSNAPWKLYLSKLAVNFPEIAFCILVPLFIINLSGLRILVYWVAYGAALAFFSLALLVYSAQVGVLFLPLAFPIFALSKFGESAELKTDWRPYTLAIKLVLVFVIATIAYPMMLNVAYASARYLAASPLSGVTAHVGSMRTKETSAPEFVALTSVEALRRVRESAPLDAFMVGRESKGRVFRVFWDTPTH